MLEKTKAKADAKPKAAKASKPIKAAGARTAAKPAATRRPQEDVHDRIQRRAYELWESEGRPEGREHMHWQQAEHELAGAQRQRAA